MAAIASLVILVAVVLTVAAMLIRSTPNARRITENHQQMARVLDRILADDQRIPVLPRDVAERAAELVGQFYQDRTNRNQRKALK